MNQAHKVHVYNILHTSHAKLVDGQELGEYDRTVLSEFCYSLARKASSTTENEFLTIVGLRISLGKELRLDQRQLILAYMGTALEFAYDTLTVSHKH